MTGTDPDSKRGFVDYYGKPDVFPPVTVNNAMQEGEHRAKGYVGHDEPDPALGEYQEFPKWMSHATHEPVLVNTTTQQAEAVERGYFEPGQADPIAVEAAHASPYVPGRQLQEYPRMEGGVLVQDPDDEPTGPIEYPKALTPPGGGEQVFVKSRAEEKAMFAKWGIPSLEALVKAGAAIDANPVPGARFIESAAKTDSERKAETNARRSASMKARAAAKRAAKEQASA